MDASTSRFVGHALGTALLAFGAVRCAAPRVIPLQVTVWVRHAPLPAPARVPEAAQAARRGGRAGRGGRGGRAGRAGRGGRAEAAEAAQAAQAAEAAEAAQAAETERKPRMQLTPHPTVDLDIDVSVLPDLDRDPASYVRVDADGSQCPSGDPCESHVQ